MDNTDLLEKIEDFIVSSLPECVGELEFVREILSYSLDGGGKRVRPLLCAEFCLACGGQAENALHFAAAVEYVHTYSLIHDDLPCMDDDDYRRGKPSSHKKYGEANAVLAGDALLTHAFSLLARAAESGAVTEAAALKAVGALSSLSGVNGMVGGQYLDMAYEGKNAAEDILFKMDALKTGALIKAACVLGCIAGNGGEAEIKAAGEFAVNLGLAFQLTDDILEYESDARGSDEKNDKSTYITLLGPEKAKALAENYTADAISALAPFGSSADAVRETARELLRRNK